MPAICSLLFKRMCFVVDRVTQRDLVCRVEDGVTQLDLVFTGRQLVVDPRNLWKNRLHLLEYSAIRLKRIRVKNPCMFD